MTTYTTYGLPKYDTTDLIADGTTNLRTSLNQISTTANSALSGVEARANSYADSGDTATLTSANGYTDTEIATLSGNISADYATKSAVAAADYYQGGLPLNANLADYTTPRTYAVSSAMVAQSITPALPTDYANVGALQVLRGTSAGYYSYEWTVIGGGVRGTLKNDYQNGVWTGWRETEYDPTPRVVPDGANIDTYIRDGGKFDGSWMTFTDAASAGITGLPEGETSLFHLQVFGGTGHQMIQFYKGGLYWRAIISAGTSTFGPWERLDPLPVPASYPDPGTEREVRTAQAHQRVGGRIGTGGVPAIALRFDDWSDEMQSVVMPELRARNLPAGWAATVAYVETHGSQSWPVVSEWVRDGVELLGHSWSHTNASGDTNIHKEIIESADYIETQVPSATIDTWVMPGTSAGPDTYDGFGIGDKIEHFYSKPAGRMMLQRYPIVAGAQTGRFLPLTGEPSIGRSHLTIDNLAAADVIDDMAKARNSGVGFILMAHPIHIGKTDKISLADFRAVLDWIAAERDAGRIRVLTPRGISYADKSSADRLSCVPNVDHWTEWNTRTDWSDAGDHITTTTGGVMVRAINVSTWGFLRGGVVEVTARVRTPTGAVVRTGITGGAERTVDHTLPASSEWRWVQAVATIPANLSDTGLMVAEIGRVSGGQVDIDYMAVQPV